MTVIINRETTTCSACGQTVTIEHSQIACREYTRLGLEPSPIGVVGKEQPLIFKAERKIRK